jgi:hypothetical protein
MFEDNGEKDNSRHTSDIRGKIFKMDGWAEHVARLVETRTADNILVGRPKWNRPLTEIRSMNKSF